MLRRPALQAMAGVVAAALALALGALAPSASAAQTSDAAAAVAANPSLVPRTVVLDGKRLAVTRTLVRAGVPALRAPLSELLGQADSYLTAGPWSVTDKPQTPPSGDKHDYLSEAPYWWPTQPATADNPWGCPYVQKDGVRNPAIDTVTDHAERGEMFNAVYDLTLAWWYTGKAEYAQRAALDLRTWFIDPATRMNPNLDYTQFIPCKTDGRGIGIIDFSQQYTDVLDALAMLNTGAPGWSRDDESSMTDWNARFLSWLRTSQNGQDEAAATNNHGSFFDMQEAALALSTGQSALARQIVVAAERKRIDDQVAGDGSLPQELSRTRSFHYSTFDLVALTRLAMIGQRVGVDLWHYTDPAGGNLFKAVDLLIPAATGKAAWTYPELEFQAFAATDVIHAAADAGDPAARAAVPELPAPPGGDIWPLRPAAEQLDPISGS
ncbi:alginate lyase family protein [Phaeacidiphilus oryzae]|uniref:alginate lyase family protein n=1 Tax=Phaeacidiphilus oryzae TaxID=348818 RepID=UPI00056A88FB|nr:alginate lyase family protein [Phaeacidiphilus oryzae]